MLCFHLFSGFEPTVIWGKSGGGCFFSTLRYTTVKMLQYKTGAVCFKHDCTVCILAVYCTCSLHSGDMVPVMLAHTWNVDDARKFVYQEIVTYCNQLIGPVPKHSQVLLSPCGSFRLWLNPPAARQLTIRPINAHGINNWQPCNHSLFRTKPQDLLSPLGHFSCLWLPLPAWTYS